MGLGDVILHWLHILFVSIWVGGLASFLIAYRVDGFNRVYREVAKLMIASLILIALSGLLLASSKYNGPSAWFDFGSPIGRIGEKITALILMAVIMGYTHHSITKRNSIAGRDAVMVGLALIISFGAMILGVMLVTG